MIGPPNSPHLEAITDKKPDPCGSGCSLPARGPTITFQRGTADGASPPHQKVMQQPTVRVPVYASTRSANNRMSACQPCEVRSYFPGIPCAPRCLQKNTADAPNLSLEMPALRFCDQKITKDLHAGN